MELDRGERELFCNLSVFDTARLVDLHAFDPLGRKRTGRDRRSAAEGFELRIDDLALVVDLDLQAHHVAASGRPDQPGANSFLVLVHAAHVPRIFVVIDYLLMIGSLNRDRAEPAGGADVLQESCGKTRHYGSHGEIANR